MSNDFIVCMVDLYKVCIIVVKWGEGRGGGVKYLGVR